MKHQYCKVKWFFSHEITLFSTGVRRVPLQLNHERVKRVADAIHAFGVDRILALEERDPQYHVAQRLSRLMGRGKAAILLALVALASYRLAMKGEEYWNCLAETVEKHGSNDPLGDAVYFLRTCRGAIVRRDVKIRRVQKAYSGARSLWEKLGSDPDTLPVIADKLLDTLSRVLKADKASKTLVFAVKMAYYAVRPPGLRKPYPVRIPVPVDVRVSCLTFTSGVVDAGGYREILGRPGVAREAWRLVAGLSGVPELHLDALLWTSGRIVMESSGEVVTLLARHLDPRSPPEALRLAGELAWRRCI